MMAVAPASFSDPFTPPTDPRVEIAQLRDQVESLQSIVDALNNRLNELAQHQASSSLPLMGDEHVIHDDGIDLPRLDVDPPAGSTYIGSSRGMFYYRTEEGDLFAASRKVRPVSVVAAAADVKVKGDQRAKVYHLSTCPGYGWVSPQQAVDFDTESDAVSAGYSKAGNCKS
jgi:hypothetical protein